MESMLKSTALTALCKNFYGVDENLTTLGFSDSDKTIYRTLSAILNMGNIEFDAINDNDSCFITAETQIYLRNAAILLNMDIMELSKALTSYTRVINKQNIM